MTEQKKSILVQQACEVIEREAAAVRALIDQFDDSISAVVETLASCQGHVLVTGAGTSRTIAERFAHLLSCCGVPALFIHSADSLHGGAGAVKPGDVVYIISKGGHSSEINQFARIAKDRGAKLIAHTENPASPLAEMSDQVFCVVAPREVDPYGMIATGSSLVNGAACDALCVLLLQQRGYTREEFEKTHPGGAVGKKISGEIPI